MNSNIIIFVLVLVILLLVVVQLQPQKQNVLIITPNSTIVVNTTNQSISNQSILPLNSSSNSTLISNTSNSSINVSVIVGSNATQNISISNNSTSETTQNASNSSLPNFHINLTLINNSISPAQNISIQNQSQNRSNSSNNSSNISANGSIQFPRIPPVNISISVPNLSGSSVSGPGIVYSSSNSFRIIIDGNSQVYDKVGVFLTFGEKAYVNNASSLFIADYPDSSPRDLVIRSRVTKNRQLESWRNQVIEQGISRKTVAISFLNDQRQEIERITYRNAWPSKYKVILTPDGFEEEITIVSESVERTN